MPFEKEIEKENGIPVSTWAQKRELLIRKGGEALLVFSVHFHQKNNADGVCTNCGGDMI